MTLHLGDVAVGKTLYIPFATYNSAGASITMTGFAVGDIKVFKNGSVTERASTAGFTLLDTDGTDFDGLTGIHGFSINLADNTDAGFYVADAFYWVFVSAVTIDGQTVNFIAATFRIGDFIAQADALLDRDMSLGTDSGTQAVRTVRQALRFLRNKWSISGTTMTVTKENDTAESWHTTLTGSAGANPVTASDPADS